MKKASDRQNAVRLLACIVAGGRDPEPGKWDGDIVAILDGQARLQALDFWMRYPDYLANELLNSYEDNGSKKLLDTARRIFDDREPDLRHLPMVRYHFGAFEPLDTALAILRSADLIRIRRIGQPGRVQRHLYLLTQRGLEAMKSLAKAAPELAWYRDRAQLVAAVAGGRGGTALKDRQYLQKEYAETDLSQPIRSISDRVLERLRNLESEEQT
ncbi:hypothetical protein [uncultured Roseovarius sp.]|uniref:hypothetical protein n=1 Tax=uncultured Roseovarius sp. TaxID=293344 RepID=UPI002630C986|nr:hypothetical protein [uncultured Roseovarius sp.]